MEYQIGDEVIVIETGEIGFVKSIYDGSIHGTLSWYYLEINNKVIWVTSDQIKKYEEV